MCESWLLVAAAGGWPASRWRFMCWLDEEKLYANSSHSLI
jgi:hypothetical protein